ncbi:3-carboxy-cis,cis-muconate cycloisomerase [Rhizobium sp. NFR07]|uniref:3-carboxy-cis,cis-muconate cycloisomerase n=1 Tax=Rhizobium sp. NFR07 TaxID=1566262 RepID=UPI0008E939FA|nr:3-carboxy-cis,cis-muconate cycloisomerase [Rhizobium sp. NFR07]SFA78623.1 3-carboxy-cis,cis-muconate cycloisomerase [Rhizobium sp. NFR07]
MSIAAFDHPFLSGLVGDDEIAALFGAEADIAAMLSFEAALAEASAAHGLIPHGAARQIAEVCRRIRPDIDRLRLATARDGVVVPELVRQLRDAVSGEAATHVHFGATSQDVIDTSLMIRLKRASVLFESRLLALIDGLDVLAARFGDAALMGKTRMQPALPITTGERIGIWRDPLARHHARLQSLLGSHFVIQLGGAVGTLEKFGDKAGDVRCDMAAVLQLADAPQFHSQRDRIVEIANVLAMITGSLGKFGQDVALMAQAGSEISLSGGGGSSAMAHKQNPVAAEVLVGLARFNAVQAGGMQHAMIHEQERSGAAWALEWLILPQMVMTTGAALRLAHELIDNIRRVGKSEEDA